MTQTKRLLMAAFGQAKLVDFCSSTDFQRVCTNAGTIGSAYFTG
jgi:hypothetical protein